MAAKGQPEAAPVQGVLFRGEAVIRIKEDHSMGRSIRTMIVAAVVVALAGLAIFASAAFAYSSSSINSCYSSAGGIGHAANTSARYNANGYPVSFWGRYSYPCFLYN